MTNRVNFQVSMLLLWKVKCIPGKSLFSGDSSQFIVALGHFLEADICAKKEPMSSANATKKISVSYEKAQMLTYQMQGKGTSSLLGAFFSIRISLIYSYNSHPQRREWLPTPVFLPREFMD